MTPGLALKASVATALHGSGALALHRRLFLRNRALVLMYHRILDPADISPGFDPGMYVSTPAFERHLDFLTTHFQLVDLDEVLSWLDNKASFDRIPCALTFDDGWRDNYLNAYPLLRRFRAPATIFVVTELLGTPEMLTWQEVQEMEDNGIRFASHTATHQVLTAIDGNAVEREIADSRVQLGRRTRNPSQCFCYPKGFYNCHVRDTVAKYYRAAVTTQRGAVSRGIDPFQIPRIGLHNDISSSTAMLALRLSNLG